MRALLFAVAFALTATAQNHSVALIVSMTCDATYGASGSTGTLSGHCSGLVQPYGMASMTLALTGGLNSKGDVTSVGGTMSFTLGGGLAFTAVIQSASARTTPKGLLIQTVSGITQGAGAMANPTGTLALALDGVEQKVGTARISASGSGTLTAPKLKPPLPVPAGPGTLGNSVETGNTACGDPVTVSNGNMYHQFTDIVLAGPTFPLSLDRTYNSQAAAIHSPFGFGWSHRYQASITVQDEDLVYVTRSGSALRFTAQGAEYRSAMAPATRLIRDADGFRLIAQDGFVSRFDSSGRLLSLADANANTHTLAYDSAGHLLSVSSGAGDTLTLSSDGHGRIVSAQDHTGRRVSYVYDANGDLSVSIDITGQRTTFEYANHFLHRITSPGANPIAFEYDLNGKVARNTRPDGAVLDFSYAANQTILTDSSATQTEYGFSAAGQTTSTALAGFPAQLQTWNGAGRIESTTDETGARTTFLYDSSGRVLSRTSPLGNVISFTYDFATGQIASFTDPAGNRTDYSYDARGNLTARRDPLGQETRYAYDAAGRLLSETNPAGQVVQVSYDTAGNPVEQSDAAGVLWRAGFDKLRRITSLTAGGAETSTEFDAANHVTKLTGPLGVTSRTYNETGQLASIAGPGIPATTYGYDPGGNLISATNSLGDSKQFEYAPGGLLAATVNPLGERQTIVYDAMRRPVELTGADGRTHSYAWNARGDLIARTDQDGNQTLMEYDADRRLTRTAFPDGTEQTFTYDPGGRLSSASNETLTLYYAYDPLGRLASITDSRGPFVLSYTYDAAGNRATMTDPAGGITTYAYDEAGRLSALSNPAGHAYAFAYGPDRKLNSITFPNGLRGEFLYDSAGRSTAVSYGSAASYSATWDAAGNRSSVTGPEGTHAYEFDSLNRIVSAVHPTLPAASYSYNADGKRFPRVERSYQPTLDAANRLASVELADGRRVVYRYDPFGRVVEREREGRITRLVYDAGQPLMELGDNNEILLRRTFAGEGGRALELQRGAETLYYAIDVSGNAAALLRPREVAKPAAAARRADSADAELVQTVEYNPFGEAVTTSTDPTFAAPESDVGFLQIIQDQMTKLNMTGSVVYDPENGEALPDKASRVEQLFALVKPAGGSGLGGALAAIFNSTPGTTSGLDLNLLETVQKITGSLPAIPGLSSISTTNLPVNQTPSGQSAVGHFGLGQLMQQAVALFNRPPAASLADPASTPASQCTAATPNAGPSTFGSLFNSSMQSLVNQVLNPEPATQGDSQSYMTNYSQMTELLTNLLKSNHDIQMTIIRNLGY